MATPPGLMANLSGPATQTLGGASLPAGYAPPGAPQGGIPLDPTQVLPYGPGPEPIGVRPGVDDYAQMNTGEPVGENGVAGDAVEEQQFEFPAAIDRDLIKDAKKPEWLSKLENELDRLIEDGKMARKSGGRDAHIEGWRNLFNGHPGVGGGMWKGSSRVVPPEMRAAIETTNARDMEAYFASRERLRFVPQKGEDSDTGRKCITHIDAVMNSPEINLRKRLTDACLTGRVDGGIVCDCFWRRDKQRRRTRVRVTPDLLREFAGPKTTPWTEVSDSRYSVQLDGKNFKIGTVTTVEREVVTRNHFDFRFVNMQDVFMYPATCSGVDEATVFGYEFAQTENEMRVCASQGQYDEKAVRQLFGEVKSGQGILDDSFIPHSMPTPIDDSPKKMNTDAPISDNDNGVSPMNEGDTRGYARYRMRKFWCRVRDANNDGLYEDFLVVMEVSRRKILYLQMEPFDNLKRSMKEINFDPPVGGGFYSNSMVQKCKDTHLELQAIKRLGIDLSVLAATVIIPVEPSARRHPPPFVPGPQYWKTDEWGTFGTPITFPIVQNQFIPDRGMLSSDIEKITGASEILTGATSTSSTATEANIQVQSSGIRAKAGLSNIVDFLTWLYNQYKDYTQQYMEVTPGNSFAVSLGPGRGFEDIDLETISVEGSLTAYCDALDPDVALEYQAAEKKMTLLMQSPMVQSDLARQWQVMLDYIKVIDRHFQPEFRMGTKDEATQMQLSQAEQEKQQAAEQAKELKVPNLPPNISETFAAFLLAENPGSETEVLPVMQQVYAAASAGRIKEQNAKATGEVLKTALTPPKPEPAPIGSTSGSNNKKAPVRRGGR